MVALVGNKIDEVNEDPSKRAVEQFEIDELVKQEKLVYFETSAKLGLRVRESLEELIELIYKRGSENPGNRAVNGFDLSRRSVDKRSEGDSSNCCG